MMMKKLTTVVISASMLGMMLLPFGAFAQVISTTATIEQLLLQFQQWQAQCKSLQEQKQQLQVQQQETISQLVSALRQGSVGDNVKTLQALLAADPDVYPEGLITGYYGNLTMKAVRQFQKKHGIEQAGVVGPKTLKKLNEFLAENPIAFENTTSTDDDDDNDGKEGKRHCAIVPPGHLIAPGWLRKHDGVRPLVPLCQIVPPGILKKLTPTSTPPAPTSTPDVTAPSITIVTAVNVSSSSATITWMTNELATSKVYASTTSPVATSTAQSVSNVALVTSHSLNLTGLTASSTYYYFVESADASNNVSNSNQQSFLTL